MSTDIFQAKAEEKIRTAAVGGTERVRVCEIVGIFDLDGKLTTPDTANLLRQAEHAGKTRLAGDDLPKSFLLLRDGTVVFSVYAASVLRERITF